MKHFPIYKISPWHLAMLLTLAIAPPSWLGSKLVLAQSAASESFPVPSAVPQGTNVQIGGSNLMESVDAKLKERFEKKFPGTEVKVAYSDVDTALKELVDGKVDLVAIGRPLTAEEKTQGLSQLSFARHKMAIIVGADNSFQADGSSGKSLTSEQFAKIFRGEITNWSEVGGKAGDIKVIDRPNSSESRQALSRYQVFPANSLQPGSNSVQLTSDRTEDVVKELGGNGISYAPAAEVLDKPGVRVLALYNTLPTNPKYPFSLPLSYVYKGATPSDKVKAFLGYAIAAENQDIIANSKYLQPREAVDISSGVNTTSSPDTASTATPGAETALVPGTTGSETNTSPFPWWLLLIPLLGIPLLLWLLKGKKPAAAPVAAVPPVAPVPPVAAVPPVVAEKSRIILTPRDCRHAYAYWEIPRSKISEIRGQAGQRLILRLHDVTDIPDMDRQAPHSTKEFPCNLDAQDLHLSIPRDDRDYVAEIGYETSNGRWLQIARSEHVRVPACPPELGTLGTSAATKLQSSPTNLQTDSPTKLQGSSTKFQDSATKFQDGVLPIVGAVTGGVAASFLGDRKARATSRIILTPRNCREAYAYWEVNDDDKELLRRQGGQELMLRVYEAPMFEGDTPDPQFSQEFECKELDWDRHVQIPADDRDYVAELGYIAADGTWLSLVKSDPVRVPAC